MGIVLGFDGIIFELRPYRPKTDRATDRLEVLEVP